MEAIYFSPMLLGACLILAVAISATFLWFTTRPIPAPLFWMIGAWSLVIGVLNFSAFLVTDNPVVNVLGNVLPIMGEALLVLGVFRFIGRPIPYWIIPVSILIVGGVNIHVWVNEGNSDLLMAMYSIVAGLLPLQAVYLLLKIKDEPAIRSGRIFVAICLGLYSIVVFTRAWIALEDFAAGQSYTEPYESFGYLLPYNFGIPILVMAFISMTLMTMQRILAMSKSNAVKAENSAQRFERLLHISSAGIAVIRDGRIIDSNEQLESLFGVDRNDLLENEFALYFRKNAREQLYQAITLSNGGLIDIDVKRPDGSILNSELRVLPLTDESGDFIVELRDISHRRTLEDELKRLATVDPLTGVLNRRSFEELFARALKLARRQGNLLSLAIFDLDHFKETNDKYGHQAGDEALKFFSQYCANEARGTDVFARIGGEEFALLMPDTDIDGALTILRRVLDGVASTQINHNGLRFGIGASAGVAQYQMGDSMVSLMKRADDALYKSKVEGRNRISVAEPV